jgi:hypothetical protein
MRHAKRRRLAYHSPIRRSHNSCADIRAGEATKLQWRQRISLWIRLAFQIGRWFWPRRSTIWHQMVLSSHEIGLWLHRIVHKSETWIQQIGPTAEHVVHEIIVWLRHIAHLP